MRTRPYLPSSGDTSTRKNSLNENSSSLLSVLLPFLSWLVVYSDVDTLPETATPAELISLWALCEQFSTSNERLKRACLLKLKKKSAEVALASSADSDSDDF